MNIGPPNYRSSDAPVSDPNWLICHGAISGSVNLVRCKFEKSMLLKVAGNEIRTLRKSGSKADKQ